VPVLGIAVAGLHWRWMFYVPPIVLLVLLVAAWFNVKNHPEEVGFTIVHDDAEDDYPTHRAPAAAAAPPTPCDGARFQAAAAAARMPLGQVFRIIMRNPLAWLNASAYLCTGFVRRGVRPGGSSIS